MTPDLLLRSPSDDDVAAISRVVDAQDIAWWGSPDGDADDTRDELAAVVGATGSLERGARLAVVGGRISGVGLILGHGHTSLAVDPTSPRADDVRRALIEWVSEHGGREIEAPRQDAIRLEQLAALGFAPRRSSFELERPGAVVDLPRPRWPDGIAPVAFRVGIDDEELHAMIYSFWTEVEGHTYRPIEEWRARLLTGSWFDAELVVVARADRGDGPIVGCALGRFFTGDVGWVSQLGVAPSARGVGLGRALLLEACHRLGRRRPRVIGLGVEAENANALGLYRSVGMEIVREWVHCERSE